VNVRRVIPRGAIPSIDDPFFADRYPGSPEDSVVVVEAAERPRAYPVPYLHYHEIVNDVVDGRQIAVTWCPLCGSAVVYDRRHDGRTLEFGVSGKLADDDLVMYDRETESEWKQSNGVCIAGQFEGESLSVRPASVVPWSQFRESYPDGTVLQRPGGESEAASDDDTPAPIDYERSPYDDYFDSDGFGLDAHRGEGSREWQRDDITAKTVVIGVEFGEDVLGFPLPRVRDAGGVVQTAVGDRDVVVFATDESGIHAFVDPGHSFERTADGFVADGAVWDPATGRSADGRQLHRLPARRLFAFAWQDDHGSDAFYRAR